MRKNDPVKNIMSADVWSAQEGQPLSEVRNLMCDYGIHHVPILRGKELIGLISFNDVMQLSIVISGATEHTIDAILDQQYTISDVMSKELTTIKLNDSVRQASDILAAGRFHSIPVVDEDNNLQGIVTSTDLIRYLSSQY